MHTCPTCGEKYSSEKGMMDCYSSHATRKGNPHLAGHTKAGADLLAALMAFEQDVASMEGYRAAVYKHVDRLKLSIKAGRL